MNLLTAARPAVSPLARSGRAVRRLALAGLVGLISLGAAQAQDSTLTRLVQKHSLVLTQSGAQFGGAGWERLRQDVQQSRFVLIGEDHGIAQIPVFSQAVARELQPALFVAEVDQYQAAELSQAAARPTLPTALLRQHPMYLSFYSWAEEFELAQALRARNVAFLGLDQVGAATPGRLLTQMAEQSRRKETQAYLRRRAATLQARDRAAFVSGQFERSAFVGLTPAGLDSLRAATQKEGPQVRQMMADFAASYKIYQEAAAGKASSHYTRINLMKRNLLQGLQPYQQAGQPLPKTLFKFGANHVARGRSMWGDIYDVGNLAANLAEAQDQKSLHIMIMGKQGTQVGGMNPDDFSKNVASYSHVETPFVKPFVSGLTEGWRLVDLRPLRRALLAGKLQVRSKSLESVILGYDYLVVAAETTASRNY